MQEMQGGILVQGNRSGYNDNQLYFAVSISYNKDNFNGRKVEPSDTVEIGNGTTFNTLRKAKVTKPIMYGYHNPGRFHKLQ